jgi:hypothetical protein
MLPQRKELERLIREAMPLPMKRELSQAGTLDKTISERATRAQEVYQAGLSGMLEAQGATHQELVSNGIEAQNLAAREALDQAVEFETQPEEQTILLP